MKFSNLFILLAAAVLLSSGTIAVSSVAIDEKPSIKIDEDLVGIWKMREDTDRHNYFVVEKQSEFEYVVSYMNRGGDNRRYEHFHGFLSVVKNKKFLNIESIFDEPERGYLLLEIVSIDHNGFELTARTLSDAFLKQASSSQELRKRLSMNAGDPSVYEHTLHFRKKLPLKVWK